MALDIDEVRAELLKKFDLVLSRDDPVFAVAMFNERVLSALVDEIAAILRKAQDDVSAGQVQQLDLAKRTAEKLVTQAGSFIASQVTASMEESSKKLMERLDVHVREVEARLIRADSRVQATNKGLLVSALVGGMGVLVGTINAVLFFAR
jgi:hypothetical protein